MKTAGVRNMVEEEALVSELHETRLSQRIHKKGGKIRRGGKKKNVILQLGSGKREA